MTEDELIKQLRAEVEGVKQCFTRFSFQALTFSATALGLVVAYMTETKFVELACIPTIIILMIVCRIGIFKYGTANRNNGYELHLARTKHFKDNDTRWESNMRNIPWEEACRAWRTVQIRIFKEIYFIPDYFKIYNGKLYQLSHYDLRLYKFRDRVKDMMKKSEEEIKTSKRSVDQIDNKEKTDESHAEKQDAHLWFLPKELSYTKGKYAYHAGTYLKNMLGLLIFMQYILLVPLALRAQRCIYWKNLGLDLIYHTRSFLFDFDINRYFDKCQEYAIGLIGLFIFLIILISIRAARVNRRREILENELLSIHSCAIVWQAVIIAHFEALNQANESMKYYTRNLAEIADEIARKYLFHIHEYCNVPGMKFTSEN